MTPAAPTKSFKKAYSARLDDKRRLTIPADWRFEGEGASSYLAVYHPAHAAIMVLPPDMKDRIESASRRPEIMSDPVKFDALMRLGELSQDIACDKAGRVVLDESLLRAAGIERDVELKGAFSSFLIRSVTPPAPDRESAEARGMLEALAELMK